MSFVCGVPQQFFRNGLAGNSLHMTKRRIPSLHQLEVMWWSCCTATNSGVVFFFRCSPPSSTHVLLSSTLARMSVVVQCKDGSRHVFAKGSPKEIRTRCKTVTADFDTVLNEYTSQGMRLVALATRPLGGASPEDRTAVESNMTMLGLLVLRNPVKESSAGLIQSLSAARIRTVMITGDNALTAIAVSRTLGIVEANAEVMLVDDNKTMTRILAGSMSEPEPLHWDEALSRCCPLALSGAAFEAAMASPHASAIMQACNVFARAQPLQKLDIVAAFQHYGRYTVGMCGDGSNDCGALKVADAGLSISDGEAAIAAPFSARSAADALQVVLEGRCALATSFAIFKFMILYSVVQFTGIIICYTEVSLFSDLQFLWIDLFTILPLACTLGLTPPVERLLPARPPASLLVREIERAERGRDIVVASFSHMRCPVPFVGGVRGRARGVECVALRDVVHHVGPSAAVVDVASDAAGQWNVERGDHAGDAVVEAGQHAVCGSGARLFHRTPVPPSLLVQPRSAIGAGGDERVLRGVVFHRECACHPLV